MRGVHIHVASIKESPWQAYALRFVLGGLVTVCTGLIATKFGPAVGGLFLAFPAIFPASATLVESHEIEKQHMAGYDRTNRGRDAAALEARGAALGAVGLVAFALVVWQFLPTHPPLPVLLAAAAAWLTVAIGLWWFRRALP
jgi:hypothetical protein